MTKSASRIAWAVVALTLMFAAVAPTAASAGGPHRYSLKPGKTCRKAYKRVKHRHKVFCVKRKAAPPSFQPPVGHSPTPKALERTKLHSHVDPTYTRDPLNPFKVTYAFSASATQEPAAGAAVASLSAEEPAPLPSGVLALYSDGRLECAINVGGSATGGDCPVLYQALGDHTVTKIYTSGEESATDTEVERIDPLASTTTLSIVYADLPAGPKPQSTSSRCRYGVNHECGAFCHFVNTVGGGEEECVFEQEWQLGIVSVDAASSPAGAVSVRCNGDILPCFGETAIDMYAEGSGRRTPVGEGVAPSCTWMKEHADTWQADRTIFSAVAKPTAAGYAGEEVTKTIPFAPALPC